MKKLKKLGIKKITLQDLDKSFLCGVAGGNTAITCVTNFVYLSRFRLQRLRHRLHLQH